MVQKTQKKDKLDDGFLVIPVEVLCVAKVNGITFSLQEKCLYAYLMRWSKNSRSVYPSIRKICKDLGVGSRQAIQRYIKNLEKMKLLTVDRNSGKNSNYVVQPISLQSTDLPSERTLTLGTNKNKVYDKEIPTDNSQIPEENENVCASCGQPLAKGDLCDCVPY